MASINIEPPISPPADKWASNTADALETTSKGNAMPTQPMKRTPSPTQELGRSSGTSPPGLDFPGAFPRDSQAYSSQPPSAEERTPHVAAVHLAEAAPQKTSADIQESARGYLPSVDVQHALDTAGAYLPHSIVGAVGSVLPTNGSQVEKEVDPTSGAKPASDESASWASTALDDASTTALAPSSRTGSLSLSFKEDLRTPIAESSKPDVADVLDVTSQAKPDNSNITSPVAMSNAPAFASTAAPTLEFSNTLPTPPDSSDGTEPVSQTMGRGTEKRSSSGHNELKTDKTRHPADLGPTPPPKDDLVATDKSTLSQQKFHVTPTQVHIKSGSGTGVGTQLPGSALGGGDPSTSPMYEFEDKDDAAAANLSNESLDASGKKEGRVKKAVHKVKDKLTRNH